MRMPAPAANPLCYWLQQDFAGCLIFKCNTFFKAGPGKGPWVELRVELKGAVQGPMISIKGPDWEAVW